MTGEQGLGYVAYLAWLAAGCGDYACHRRAGLAATSGAREWWLHVAQMALVAAGLVVALLFDPGGLAYALMALAVVAHAVVGYLDTVTAWQHRPITPVEQHLHSVLDAAPWIALVAYILASHRPGQDWALAPRESPLPALLWAALLLPAAVLVAWPAARELADVRRWHRRVVVER